MMPVAEESGRPDWREYSKQMVRVVATWNKSLSQLTRTNAGFLDNSSGYGREKMPTFKTQFGFKREGERF